MKKIFIIAMLAMLSASPLVVSAASVEAGLKPGDFFYFLDRGFEGFGMFFTFNKEKRAQKAIEHAEERLAEAEALIKDKKDDKVKDVLEDYDESVVEANKEAKEVKEDEKKAKLLSIIDENYTRHKEVLERVLEQVPEQAKESIQKVITKSLEKYEEAIKKIEELKSENEKLKEEIEKIKKIKEGEDEESEDNDIKEDNEEKNNFEEMGTILDWDAATETHTGKWRLLYDKLGANALVVNLNFNDKSLCKVEGKDKPCSEATLKNGDGAKVRGVRNNGEVLVRIVEFPVRESSSENEKQIGYIKKVYSKDGKTYIDIDYIQWLSGAEAEKAAREDGQCRNDDDCSPPNGYYIRNQNPQIRTFEISKDALVFDESGFLSKIDIVQPNTINPYRIELSDDDVIVRITKQYIP